MKTVLAAVLKAVAVAMLFVLATVLALITGAITIALRAAPIIIAVVVCVWILTGCTTNVYNVTVDNSVIDQSDVTQVLGCATDDGLLVE